MNASADRLLLALAALIAIGNIVGTALTTGAGGSIVQGDARGYFAYLPSLVFDGDVTLNNQFETLQPEGKAHYPYGKGPDGRAANPFPIAPSLLWLPGYLAGVGVESVMSRIRPGGHPPGYGAAAAWGAAAASVLVAGLGGVMTRRLIAVSIGARDALPAVLATWLGTAALYYTLITPLYSHAASWFGVASMLYATHLAAVQPLRIWRWLVAGLLAGYMVAIRLPDAALLVMPFVMFAATARQLWPDWRPLPACVLAWSIGVAVGYLPQGITSYLLYGHWVTSSPTELGATFQAGVFVDALFSSRYEGWISWTPMIALALAGLVVLMRRGHSAEARRLAFAAILGVIALYLMDVFHPYSRPGAAFGARRYVSGSPLIAIGIAGALNVEGGRFRWTVTRFLWALVAWNIWLLTCYELLVNVYRVYPTLLQTMRFAIGLGPPS